MLGERSACQVHSSDKLGRSGYWLAMRNERASGWVDTPALLTLAGHARICILRKPCRKGRVSLCVPRKTIA
jgi:hypothetical protein